jgi:large subunit ribosomal protein L14
MKGMKFFNFDNTGVSYIKCVHIYGTLGLIPSSIILCTIRKVIPLKKIKKGQLFKGVVVRLCKIYKRKSGICVNYYTNGVVLLKKIDPVPIGTRVFGSVYIEIRKKGFMKIISLSSFTI